VEYKHVNEFPPQALVIEDAETEILEYTKRAAYGLHSQDRFKREVDDIINRALEKLKNESLREKTREGLRLYAQRCYRKHRNIMFEQAAFFALLVRARADKIRGAEKELKRFKEEIPTEYRQSKGFSKSLETILPDTTYRRGIPLGTYHKEYVKTVSSIFADLVQAGAKESYETNVSLRNIAEMTVRYDHQLEMIADKKKNGKKLVYIIPHANCSKRCEKYQVGGSLHPSGLYSLDGTEGVTAEGIKYKPLEFATDNPKDRYTTRSGKVYQNGCITGFNCRHKLADYIPGVKPQAIPKNVIERQRAIEEKQREYERDIRAYKKGAVSTTNKDEAKRLRKKAKDLNEEYRRFSVKNKVAWYPDRVRIFEDED
jgi:hypothetical protein